MDIYDYFGTQYSYNLICSIWTLHVGENEAASNH